MNATGPVLHEMKDPLLPWQWHSQRGWLDQETGERTTYLAGFRTRERAVQYGEMKGYC